MLDRELRIEPITLAAGASRIVECDATALFMSDCSGPLFVRLDDEGGEFIVSAGFFGRFAWAKRIKFRNAGAATVTALATLSHDPEFLALQPGGSGGGSVSDVWAAQGNYRSHPFAALLPTNGSGGSSATLRNPGAELDTGATIAPSKFRQMLEDYNARAFWNTTGGTNYWAKRHRARVRALVYNVANGGSDNSQAGLMIGALAAWPATNATCIRLAMILNTGGTFFHRLHVSNGVATVTADLTGAPAPVIGTAGQTLEIDFNPTAATPYVAALVNGTEYARITTGLPTGATTGRGVGVYVGEDATSIDQIAAAFMALEAVTYVP